MVEGVTPCFEIIFVQQLDILCGDFVVPMHSKAAHVFDFGDDVGIHLPATDCSQLNVGIFDMQLMEEYPVKGLDDIL